MCGAETLKDSSAHALCARALRGEEGLRVEIRGDDGGHRSGFDAARADGGARASERGLIGGHEARRPGQSKQAHAREATAAEIVIRSVVATIDPRLDELRQLHFFVSFFLSSASHGFSGSADSGLPKSSLVPSGSVTDVTPAAFAWSTSLPMLGLRGLRGLAKYSSCACFFRSEKSRPQMRALGQDTRGPRDPNRRCRSWQRQAHFPLPCVQPRPLPLRIQPRTWPVFLRVQPRSWPVLLRGPLHSYRAARAARSCAPRPEFCDIWGTGHVAPAPPALHRSSPGAPHQRRPGRCII